MKIQVEEDEMNLKDKTSYNYNQSLNEDSKKIIDFNSKLSNDAFQKINMKPSLIDEEEKNVL